MSAQPDGLAPAAQAFWDAFRATQAEDVQARFYEVCVFDDHEASANALAELVVRGTKRGTASLLWSFEATGMRVPRAGDLSLVTDWDGRPRCIIETTQVDTVPFCEVTATFAAIEGEGDGSLDYWRSAHAAYYARECARIGRTPDARMPVACEQFRVVFLPPQDAAG